MPNIICQNFHQPTHAHFLVVKRVLWDLKGALGYSPWFLSQSTLTLNGFCDADWVGCPLTRWSTMRFYIHLESNYVSWSSKKQSTITRSSVEAECRASASTTQELTWISYLLCDLGVSLFQPPQLFSDNIGAFHMSINLVFQAQTKHIELDYNYVREKVIIDALVTKFLPSSLRIADVLTWPRPKQAFKTSWYFYCTKLDYFIALDIRQNRIWYDWTIL